MSFLSDNDDRSKFSEGSTIRDVEVIRKFIRTTTFETIQHTGEQVAALMTTAVEMAQDNGISPVELVESFGHLVVQIYERRTPATKEPS